MNTSPEIVAEKVDQIVAEMQRLGLWEEEPDPDATYEFVRFSRGDKSFAVWLQFAFIPRVLRSLQAGKQLPPRSRVAVQAAIEFDGYSEDTTTLLKLLREFDALFE